MSDTKTTSPTDSAELEKSDIKTSSNSTSGASQSIEEILIREHYVSAEDIKKAQEYAKKNKTDVVNYLLTQELISHDLLGQAIAESKGVSYANLRSNPPSSEQILKIPETLARQYNLVLFKEEEKRVIIASSAPEHAVITSLQPIFPGKEVMYAFAPLEDIEPFFSSYKKPLETRFAEILASGQRIAPEIIQQLISDAVSLHASDIHFEPQEKDVLVRMRIDGILHEAGRIPKEFYDNVLNRIKVQSHLRIDEHYSAQDGAIRYTLESLNVDMRVSIIPTLDGEKIVMRVLSSYVRDFGLDDVGLSKINQEILMKNSKKPFGMILVTGPTGSGKSTTLYALLKILNNPELNITTIEDPVEYKITGVNQIQVNNDTNLTFAAGLKSIVRQDPNIILVGEIRDEETADIAVNAALTGHLLLSTFHANDAATAIPRLLEMGIEPFLLASTLELIIAQRLARKICESCRYSKAVKIDDVKINYPAAAPFFKEKAVTLYQGKGCGVCNNTGYIGRTALFEFLEITEELEEIILHNPSSQEIWSIARKNGSLSLYEDGIEKVKNGVTTLEELSRVAQAPIVRQEQNKKKK